VSGPFAEEPPHHVHNQRTDAYTWHDHDNLAGFAAIGRDRWGELAAALAYRPETGRLILSALRQDGQEELAAALAAAIEAARL
jgi:hypothetical protein